ncbi:MAG TPA: M3 family metallopeptidase [Trueperaceae bacterium]|nr:M3 family metallopeptidase [Trueperaceae bacterium]
MPTDLEPGADAPSNPLLSMGHRVPFDRIRVEHYAPAVRSALAWAQAELEELKSGPAAMRYDDVIGRLTRLVEWPSRVFGLVKHLNDTMNSPESRAAYNEVLPEYTAFVSGLTTDLGLWSVVKRYAASDDARRLDPLRARDVRKTVEEFVRAGADLPDEERKRAEALKVELAQLSTRFAENVLDATNAYELVVRDEARLAGLPEGVRRRAAADAQAHGHGEGAYRFSLQAPSYVPFMKHAEDRELRRELYEAFYSIAAGGQHDNRPLLRRILAKRRELANVLGYADFADLVLEDRMVKNGARAYGFLEELAARTAPYFAVERRELERFAREELGLEGLAPWDVSFVAERMRAARYDFDDEALRPYFPLGAVLDGLFRLSERLFGVSVVEAQDAPTWHPDVKAYDLYHEDGTYLGSAYADWFPRASKRAGAWMNPLVTGGPVEDGGFEPHVGVIAANFTPPDGSGEPLLTHDEVTTVFHEFGHLLHHVMSRVPVRGRSGMAVAWDFIELPSQIMENWCWEKEALDLFARHHQTGETIPDELFARLKASRTFLEATAQMRQLMFGTADLALHIRYDPAADEDPVELAQRVMEPLAIGPEFTQARRMPAFSHVFAGGYAAGYYSYKWAEVLDADAFSRFKAEGIFNPDTGREFASAVLEAGDSEDAEVLFRRFMGRDPDVSALIRRNLGPAPDGVPTPGDPVAG